jgi:hypothetical protein
MALLDLHLLPLLRQSQKLRHRLLHLLLSLKLPRLSLHLRRLLRLSHLRMEQSLRCQRLVKALPKAQ